MLAATARVAGDIDLAEECVQDAYAAALAALVRPGRAAQARCLADHRGPAPRHRPRAAGAPRELPLPCWPDPPVEASAPPGRPGGRTMIPDDRLRLIFTCCHPALAREAQVALTLRLVCGLTTVEIAAGVPGPRADHGRPDTRAKKKISAARIAYRVPLPRNCPTGSTRSSPSCTCSTPPGIPLRAATTSSAPTWSTGPSSWPACCAP